MHLELSCRLSAITVVRKILGYGAFVVEVAAIASATSVVVLCLILAP